MLQITILRLGLEMHYDVTDNTILRLGLDMHYDVTDNNIKARS